MGTPLRGLAMKPNANTILYGSAMLVTTAITCALLLSQKRPFSTQDEPQTFAARVPANTPELCRAACDKLSRRGCAEWLPLDPPCQERCMNGWAIATSCVADAGDRASVQSCGVACAGP